MSDPNGTAASGAQRRRDTCPKVLDLLELLSKTLGGARATRRHLAELVGCSRGALHEWERGAKRPSAAYRRRLVDLERKLRSKRSPLDRELAGTTEGNESRVPELLANAGVPIYATDLRLSVDGELSRLVFKAKLPGDAEKKVVADVLLPRSALSLAFGILSDARPEQRRDARPA